MGTDVLVVSVKVQPDSPSFQWKCAEPKHIFFQTWERSSRTTRHYAYICFNDTVRLISKSAESPFTIQTNKKISHGFFSITCLCGLQPTAYTVPTVILTICSKQQFKIKHESLQCDSVASQTWPNTNHSTCCFLWSFPQHISEPLCVY